MFKDVSTQGKFLSSLFSFIFTILDNKKKFQEKLEELAKGHAAKGVKSSEYAIIGEVMFWTLKLVLGSNYDVPTHEAWVKIFSQMLSVMVPLSISYELKNNKAQLERVKRFNNDAPSPHGTVTSPKVTSPKPLMSPKATTPSCPYVPDKDMKNNVNPSDQITVKDTSSFFPQK